MVFIYGAIDYQYQLDKLGPDQENLQKTGVVLRAILLGIAYGIQLNN
jgi:hypothetical protein